MTGVLEFVDTATAVLAGHAAYTWNKSATRIRCNGADCGTVLEADGGEDGAILIFARHQAEQLPSPAATETPSAQPAVSGSGKSVETEAPPVPGPDVIPDADDDGPLEATPEPAGEPMEAAVAETPTAPKVRRDTKALTATIAEIGKGDRVTATFAHPRYGNFVIEGTVVKGGTGLDRNQLSVAGWYINLNARAAKYLQELTIVAPAGKHEFAIPKPSELTEHVGIGG